MDHRVGQYVEVLLGARVLFRYVYHDDVPPHETRKPYFHPIRSLRGDDVTLYRPHDHPWHAGLTMTIPSISGDNFWGGNTYDPQHGYIQKPNNGEIRHIRWSEMTCDGQQASAHEELEWITIDERRVLTEQRSIGIRDYSLADAWWALDLSFTLRNATSQPLVFGSPATEGLSGAGYWGLHWRGVRAFAHGKVLASDGRQDMQTIHGTRSPWVAYLGTHDGHESCTTMVFLDCPRELRYPTQWYVKNDSYPSITASFVFDETYTLVPETELVLRYRVIVADGAWNHARIEPLVAELLNEG